MANDLRTYTIRTKAELYHVKIAEILYIESHARKKEIVMYDGQRYEFYGRINDIEQDLGKHGFIRPHNSFLVNSGFVRVFMPNRIWLINWEQPIPVSQRRYGQAYDRMTIYATEVE
jgi:DNA-binding LytR/AlgR family response regulator